MCTYHHIYWKLCSLRTERYSEVSLYLNTLVDDCELNTQKTQIYCKFTHIFFWSRRYLHLIKCAPAESCSVQRLWNKSESQLLCCTTPRRPNACHACSYEANLTEFPKNSKEAILNLRCSCSIWPFKFQIKSYSLTWNLTCQVVSKHGVVSDRNE